VQSSNQSINDTEFLFILLLLECLFCAYLQANGNDGDASIRSMVFLYFFVVVFVRIIDEDLTQYHLMTDES